MSLPQDFLDDLKGRLGIAEVIGKRVKLVRRGRQFLGLCPFHGERTPSFHVYDDHYHCFGCGAHGSAIDFVMQADTLGFREAVEQLAALAGMALPEATPEVRERERRRGSLLQALEAAAGYFQKMLRMPEGRPALEYLQSRGLSEAAIERFRLGFAPDGRYAVKAALAREGFTDEAMSEAGLLVQPEDDARGAYDRFRGRVMFPIADRRSRVLGFGGRLLGTGEPKYLNSPETPLFHKGRMLYGIDRAAPAVRERGTVVVVEGYMDVIGLAEAGWQNVVAPLGTALTEEQLRALWALTAEPILLFDPDAAGERAALRAAERALPLLKPGLGLNIARLQVDTGDDPDRVAARYPAQLVHRTLQEAAPLSEFLFRVENKGRLYVPPEERAALDDRLRKRAETIADAGIRGHFVRAFRERAWQSMRARPQTPGERQGKHPGKRVGDTAASAPRPVSLRADPTGGEPMDSRTRAEMILVGIVVHHPDLFGEFEEEFGRLAFADRDLDLLRQELLTLLSMQDGIAIDDLAARLRSPEPAATLRRVLDDPAVRRSASIAAHAPAASVRSSWAAHMGVLRRNALKTELAAEPAREEISIDGWARRRALIRAAIEPADDES